MCALKFQIFRGRYLPYDVYCRAPGPVPMPTRRVFLGEAEKSPTPVASGFHHKWFWPCNLHRGSRMIFMVHTRARLSQVGAAGAARPGRGGIKSCILSTRAARAFTKHEIYSYHTGESQYTFFASVASKYT